MEKILFVAYQFPPRGGAGVQRSVKLVSHLREFGYEPIVLTVREEDVVKGGYPRDESLLLKLPEGIKIVRTPSYEPIDLINKLVRWRLFRAAWFFCYGRFWERSAAWPSKVLPEAEKLIREHNIRLVYTTSGPFSSLQLGLALKKSMGVKWVADLRDPYTDAYAWDFPSKWHWLLQRKFENKTIPEADKVILNTPEVQKLFIARGLTTSAKSVCITNGY
ncbi:MAG: glycosyltransferase [Bacteroidia bacterium]|nr:glycosyltransferase [Bacteroidia bacterium]